MAKAFIEEKKSPSLQYTALKNILMENLISRIEMVESNIERVKTKIIQLNKKIEKYQNQDYDINKDNIKI